MQKLTRLLSLRLYKVEYELYPDTKYRLIEELPNNRYSSYNAISTTTSGSTNNSVRLSGTGSNRSRSKSRHLSMHEKSSNELIQPTQDNPVPEGSVSTILRNLSSASLSDIANTFKADRKSTHLASVADEEEEENDTVKKLPVHKKNLAEPSTMDKNRRAISIQQLDTLWQDSGSKLLNFVHHGDPTNLPPPVKVKEEKTEIESTSSIEELSTKVRRTLYR